MTHWKKVLPLVLGALALPVVASSYAWVCPHAAPAGTTASRRPLTCRLSVGDELGFRLHSTTEGQKPQASAPERMGLEGEMWWRVIEAHAASGWVVAATLHDVRQTGAQTKDAVSDSALQAPFLIRVGRDCGFREMAFDPTTQPNARKKIEGVVRATEVILSPVPSAQWMSRHRDEVGAFDVKYTVDPKANEDGVVVTRNRMRYDNASMPALPPALGGKLRIDVLASEGRAVLDPEGRWLNALEGSEKLRVRMGDRVMTELSATVSIARLQGRAPESLAALNRDRFAWRESAKAMAERSSDEPPPVDPALAALGVDGALDDFAAVLGSGPNGQHDATGRLAGYLAAHPEAIAEILGRIRRGELDGKLHAPFFLALEKTGTLAAERELAGALGDRGMSELNRMRAAAALQDVPRPTTRTAQALIAQARAQGSTEKPVANSALLALGALSSRTDQKQPDVARLANDQIGDSLRNARAPEDVAVALDAIGNAGDSDFAETVERYTTDPSAAVRAHAAAAYRGMDRAAMEPVLTDWLGKEPETEVRRAIASSLAEKVTPDSAPASAAVVAAAMARLPVESDAMTRGALIVLLGSAAATQPAAKQALVEHFKREQVADLLVLIGRFVGAADLR